MRFPGQYYDSESNTTYNYFRTYDSSLGRYIQSDPRGILLDFSGPQRLVAYRAGIPVYALSLSNGNLNHTYNYVNQNPLIYVDPTSEIRTIGGGAIAGGITGAVCGAIGAGEGNRIKGELNGLILGAVGSALSSAGQTTGVNILGALIGSAFGGAVATGDALRGGK